MRLCRIAQGMKEGDKNSVETPSVRASTVNDRQREFSAADSVSLSLLVRRYISCSVYTPFPPFSFRRHPSAYHPFYESRLFSRGPW